MQQLEKRLEMLDQRLDNLDSIVTALVERVMKQPVSLGLTCPKCGATIEVTMTGNIKMSGKS